MFDIEKYLSARKNEIDRFLEEMTAGAVLQEFPASLRESVSYSLLAGGKRIRPVLVLAAMETLGADYTAGFAVAASFELVHTYSLIHDDLPAMDDDDFRRGRPTNHKVYGDGMAILAGDALLTLAFEIISDTRLHPHAAPEKLVQIGNELARAAGGAGMAGGQALDILYSGSILDEKEVRLVHEKKTGALIRGAVRTGAIMAGASRAQLENLTRYGTLVGLVFQIADDILDVEGRQEITGKTVGKDSQKGKNTFPSVFGLDESKRMRDALLKDALDSLEPFTHKHILQGIANFITTRQN